MLSSVMRTEIWVWFGCQNLIALSVALSSPTPFNFIFFYLRSSGCVQNKCYGQQLLNACPSIADLVAKVKYATWTNVLKCGPLKNIFGEGNLSIQKYCTFAQVGIVAGWFERRLQCKKIEKLQNHWKNTKMWHENKAVEMSIYCVGGQCSAVLFFQSLKRCGSCSSRPSHTWKGGYLKENSMSVFPRCCVVSLWSACHTGEM